MLNATSLIEVLTLLAFVMLPVLLGFAIMKPLLKKRYGYLPLAFGAGYFLGWWLVMVLLHLTVFLPRELSTAEILGGLAMLALPLLLFKARPCSIEELRLEKATSNLTYLVTTVVFAAMLYRWGLTLLDILTHVDVNAYATDLIGTGTTDADDAPFDFIDSLNRYMLFAIGSLDVRLTALPWFGLSVALFFAVFGGLRYLGARFLPSTLAGYLVISLPMLDTFISLSRTSEVWVVLGFFITVCLLIILLTLAEGRLLILLWVFAILTYLTNNAIGVFFITLIFVAIWRMLGGIAVSVILMLAISALLVGNEWLDGLQQSDVVAVVINAAAQPEQGYLQTIKQLYREWFVLDNWHYAWLFGLGSLLILLLTRTPKRIYFGLMLMVVAGFVSLLVGIAVMLSARQVDSVAMLAGYINQTTLLFIPVFALIPVCVLHIVHNDNETIPPI